MPKARIENPVEHLDPHVRFDIGAHDSAELTGEGFEREITGTRKRKLRCAVYTHGAQAMGSSNYRPRTPCIRAKPIPSTLIDRIGEAGLEAAGQRA